MKTFLAIYMGTKAGLERSGWMEFSDVARQAQQEAGVKAWAEWGKTHAASIVDFGAPLGKTKRASPEGISDTKNSMTGYVIVRAETHEAAAKIFERHPHFSVFPGDSVEIVECLPLPEPPSTT